MIAIEHENRINEILQEWSAILRILPKHKRFSLQLYMKELFQLLDQDDQSDTHQEEIQNVWEAIKELLLGADISLVKYLVEPSSDAAKKADQWFAEMGKKIRQLRLQKNLRQIELAEKSGISQGAISRIERGLLAPTHATIERLAKALEIPPGKIDPTLD